MIKLGSFPKDTAIDLSQWAAEQKFCLIGGTGLVGRAVIRQLRQIGAARVMLLSRHNLYDEPDWMPSDICDARFASEANIPDGAIVFHFAGTKNVAMASLAPIDCFDVNTRGVWHVLEACRRAKIGRIIYASTWMVYGRPTHLPIEEGAPTFPLSIYAASKLAGESVACGYAEQYGMKVAVARLGNVYGDEVDANAVWGRIMTLAASGKDIHLRSLGAVRDYVHVDDIANGLIRLAAVAQEKNCVIANVSTGRGASVGDIATLAAAEAETTLGRRPVISADDADGIEAVPAMILNNARLQNLTNWKPQIDLETGMRRCFQSALIANKS